MPRVIILALVQSVLLVSAQVALKVALARMLPFGWNKAFWTSVLLNWPFALSGLFFGACSVLWMYIIKNYPFSVAYPLVSISYVLGMVASIVFFHEDVSLTKWVGVGLIMLGCFLIAK